MPHYYPPIASSTVTGLASFGSGLSVSAAGVVTVALTLALLPDDSTQYKMLQSGGASADPAYSTTTWPATSTINQILYSSAANTISGLATANSGLLVTSGAGVPSIGTDIPTAVTIGAAYVYRASGTDVAVADGGTGLSSGTDGGILGFTATGTIASSALLTANALILGGGAGVLPSALGSLGTTTTVLHGNAAGAPTFGAVALGADVTGTLPIGNLPGTATAGQIIVSSGTSITTAPVYTTATYPSTTTVNRLLYSSATNTVADLATANSGVLVTSGAGVPSIATDIPTAVTIGGAYVHRVGGTDVALADGGTNASLTADSGGVVYSTATALALLASTATAGQMLRSGSSAAPSWSTATYPATATATGALLRADGTNWVATTATYPTTTTVSQLLYSSATNVVEGLATANNGVLVTGGTGIPSIGTDIPTAVTIGGAYVHRVGGTDVALADGGTNASLTASNGGIFYSSATAGAILAGTATANQLLLSGSSAAPAWSTATYPATTTANQLLYSSATNTVTGLATANSSILVTSGAGVPSLATDIPTAVTIGAAYIYRVSGTDVAVADGGTGVSTFATNGVLYGNGTTNILVTAQGGANTVLTANAGAPSFSATPTLTKITLSNAAMNSTGDELLDFSGTIGATGGTENAVTIALTNNPVTTVNTVSGLDTTITNSANLGNTIYGYKALLNGTGIPASGTLSLYGGYFQTDMSALGSVGGTINAYGVYAQASVTSTVASGTFNHYGVYIANGSANGNGTTTNYGLYVETINSADTNYAAYFAGGDVYIGGTITNGVWNAGAVTSSGAMICGPNAGLTGGNIVTELTVRAGNQDAPASGNGVALDLFLGDNGNGASKGNRIAAVSTNYNMDVDTRFYVRQNDVQNVLAMTLVGDTLGATFVGPVRMSAYGAGTATFDANGVISSSPSDERLKNIHGPYSPGLAEILKVKPIRYHWLPESHLDTEHEYAGFSAQNIRDSLGDLAVGQNADGMLSLQERVILAAAINAIQQLESRIRALESR